MAVLQATGHERTATAVALLEATLESTVDGILVVDEAGRIAGHNQKFAQMWRIDPELLASGDDARVMASVLEQLVDPDGFVAEVKRLYADRAAYSFDEIGFRDGRVFERYSQPQRVDGRTVGRVWSFRDVTANRRLQEDLCAQTAELRRSQSWMRSVTETAPDAIVVMDADGLIQGWNAGAQRMFGRAEADVLGRPVTVLMPKRFRGAHVAALHERVAAGVDEMAVRVVEMEATRADGSEFPVELSLNAWSDEGRPFFTGVIRDITERRQAERALDREKQLVELLGTVAVAANEATTVEDALSRSLEAFCTHGGWPIGHAYLTPEHEPATLVHSVWHHSPDTGFDRFKDATEALSFASGTGLPGRVIASGDPVWVQPIQGDPNFPRAQAAAEAGLVAGCGFPLMVRDQPVGVLEFFATEPLAADEPMLRVMRHLGEQLGRVVERERAERRLSRHARELERLSYQQESILNSAGDGIYGVDKQGKITFINEAGARLVGLPRESLIGRDVDEVVQAELEDVTGDTTTTSAVPDVPAADVTPSAVTGRHKRADGDVFDSESINAPIVEDGDIAGSVVIFRDITEQRAVDRLKDEFISVVSHELRTPLTSIRGALGLLGGGAIGALPPTAQHMVGVATDSTDRLIRLINDILDIERMAAGKLTLQPELVAAADLVHTAVEETTGLAAEAGVTIRVVASEGSVWADTDRVVQTLTNLLGNAVKFSAPGSVVSVRTAPDRGHVRFDVEDEGRGIPQDQLEAVFGWFQQVDASDTRQQGGSGLGLAICRGIVEQRGGRIWATSQAGKGATFSFTLPVGVRRVPEPGDASRAEPIATVLVCDDDAEVVEVLVTLLETHGYRTLRAHDGAEVIELASRHTPSLLLLDLLMPGMSGKDALTELRSRPETAAIPVVVLSALSPDEVQVGPVAGWVTKPADLATLFAAVGDALATDESPLTAGID